MDVSGLIMISFTVTRIAPLVLSLNVLLPKLLDKAVLLLFNDSFFIEAISVSMKVFMKILFVSIIFSS